MYIVSLPINIVGEDMAHPIVVLSICTNVYMFNLCPFHYVQMYIVIWIWHPVYMYILPAMPRLCDTATGDPMVPFYGTLHGFLLCDSPPRTRSRPVLLWDPWSPVNSCIYLPTTSLWIVFYPSNPKDSISLSPVLMYRITCTCIILCFLGALAQAFFCRKPTQGSY